jgi:hypothetical protein
MTEYIVSVMWDDEAEVWVATSSDVGGLVLNAGSFDALLERVRFAVPELLELQGKNTSNVQLLFKAERYARVYL